MNKLLLVISFIVLSGCDRSSRQSEIMLKIIETCEAGSTASIVYHSGNALNTKVVAKCEWIVKDKNED